MRYLHFILLLFVETLGVAQGFNKRYDAFDLGNPQGGWNIEYRDEGYAVISGTTDTDSIGPGFFLTHGSVLITFIDVNGNKYFEQRRYRPYHTSVAGWSNCCDTIPGGGYVVGGASEDTTGFDEVYLMRFDVNGDTLWTKVFGDPNGNQYWIGRQVKRAPNGDFFIVGDRGGNLGANVDAFIIRTDSDGNELWRRSYGGPLIDGFVAIDQCSSNSYYAGGVTFNSTTDSDFFVQRFDDDGDTLWSISWGGIHKESNAQLTTLADGHAFIAGGWSYAPNFAVMRPYLAKLDSADGSIIWDNEYGPSASGTLFFTGKECPSGDLIAAGVTYADMGFGSGQKGLLCRTTSEGDSLWMFAYYSQHDSLTDGTGRFYDVLPTADGGFIAAGATYFSASGNNPQGISQDTWVVKVDGLGCIVPGCNTVGITEQATNLLDALSIYPNPAHEQITIALDLPQSVANKTLEVSIVAMDGKVVLRQALSASPNTLSLTGITPGLYHLHITSGGIWLTGGKLVVE